MNMNPELLFDMVAKTVPKNLHRNILIVGSLAAAYHHRDRLTGQVVATKDADVIVQPAGAVSECAQIAKRLLEAGWQRTEQCYAQPAAEPQSTLRAIRLQPSNIDAFFVELLGLPQTGQKEMKRWVPCQLDDGWYGIPCFKFMTLLAHDRRDTKVGIQHASPPLMVLANLLSHPTHDVCR